MSQMGRAVKNLEPARPLKSTLKQSHVHLPVYEVQSIEELISLTENVAASLANGCNNADGMNALLANLRLHGPQLENVSKDTLDRAFVIFRNASQDERLNIMTRLNLLELIELRAKSWQVSDGTNTYYKHKATNVEPDVLADSSLLGSSPPLGQMVPALAPGELIRTSGKFPKPTKIPGKTYCKDEIVIRNADSGKVATGAKERLVQITGPNEDKINYAKQLIEDTIRRNASPVRLDNSQDGSCSSLASSASDETVPRKDTGSSNTRNSLVGGMVDIAGSGTNGMAFMGNQHSMQPATATGSLSLNLSGYSQTQPSSYTHPKLSRNGSQNNGQRNSNAGMLLHSFSSNDASLGEYKYTVNVGQHNLKITGDCLELVKVAKLVLDDYFSSNEFLASVDMCTSFDLPNSLSSPVGIVPGPHSLITGSPFVDSGVGLNTIGASVGELGNYLEPDDDVFIVEPGATLKANDVQNNNVIGAGANNGLSRSRRSHFSRKDSAGDGLKDASSAAASKSDSNPVKRIEYERLIYYSKSPYSWELPADWKRICEILPYLAKNKVRDCAHATGDGANAAVEETTNPTKTNSLEWPVSATVTNKPSNIHSSNDGVMGASNYNRRNFYLTKNLMLQRHATINSDSFDLIPGPSFQSKHSGLTNNNTGFRPRYSSTTNLSSCVSNVINKKMTGRVLMRYKSTSD
ncbi:eukaryotic translation initiation factor 4E-binding protein Mextli isoform X2 [Anopheles bellator]|uniref:eukaryotic translation initiation factor 4E-binding protein Mextli isoform X2 n=1 Tax=Anopheles bellator TaxID=139047 RepID=UPI002649C506|nr:eukaryotic translation initiation factor 4E-binding protein Mextli isoform X2 [Anopheles bellator]